MGPKTTRAAVAGRSDTYLSPQPVGSDLRQRVQTCLSRRPVPSGFGRQATTRDTSLECSAAASDLIEKDAVQITKSYGGNTAVIVGAGPAGCVAASYLSRSGFAVKVFERRSDLRLKPQSYEGAYWMMLGSESVKVLQDIGVVLPFGDNGSKSNLTAFKGFIRMTPNGRKVVQEPTGVSVCCSRYDITKALLDAVETSFSESVRISFNHTLKDVFFDKQKATFEDEQGNSFTADYDLLVAADGSNSEVQKHMKEFDRGFVTKTFSTDRSHMGFAMQLPQDTSSLYYKLCEVGQITGITLAGSQRKPSKVPGGFLFRLTNDGAVHATMFGHMHAVFSFIKENPKVFEETMLPNDFPPEWKTCVREAMSRSEPKRLPSVIHTSRLYGQKTLFVGDAGHGICPFLGLGCNLAIQDGTYLAKALQMANGDIDSALHSFNKLRHREVQCFQLLEEASSMNELQLSGWRAVWRFLSFVHTIVYAAANQVFKQEWKSPIFSAVGQQMSAQRAVAIIARDSLLLATIAIGAVIGLFKVAVLPVFQYLITRIAL